MVNSEDFTKRLEKIMEYYGLSATAFSEAIEFNRSTISHLLSGRNKPSLDFVLKVLDNFKEVELYWLLNGKGRFPISKNEKPSSTKKNVSPSNTYIKENSQQKEIDKIIIFYKDGSFEDYTYKANT